jgi:hypothetical protein
MNKWKHVVVGDVAAGSLQAAFALDQENKYFGEIRNFRDDLSIGRIDRLMEGFTDRLAWFSRITEGTEFGEEIKTTLAGSLDEVYHTSIKFDPLDHIVIWHSGIVSEEVTLRFLASRYQGYDLWNVVISSSPMGRCTPEELLAALENIQRLSIEEQGRYREEWSELISIQSTLRIFKEAKVQSVEETFYDDMLIDASRSDFQVAARVVGKVMAGTDQIISDTFLAYRLRTLIREGVLEFNGKTEALRTYKVRKRS